MLIHDALRVLIGGETLDEATTEALFEALLTGSLDEAQIGALLALIQRRGATVDELTGAARVMRRHVTPVPAPEGLTLLDTCGTGGAPKTFNVSTAAALIAAAAGRAADAPVALAVAKHGNRSRTGRGSAEILEALGVRVDASPETQGRCLGEAGVCFSFAIHHHPAMRHAGGPRRSLGVPTIFNLLGPLTNPAGARRQLLGVYDAERVATVAEALARLGAERACVVRGDDGLDEMTTTTASVALMVEDGGVRAERVDPRALGLAAATLADLGATDLDDAERILRGVLAGEAGPRLDLALLNASAALVVGGVAGDLSEGLERARRAVERGDAAQTLETLARVSHAG